MKLKRVPWTVCAKIADLILFHGVSHSPALQKYFRINGNLPLDKYTLKAIKKLFDVFEYEPRKSVRELLNEESNLSMGSIYKYTNLKKINEKKLYYDLQDDIKKFIMKINVKGLNSFHLDRFAWRNGLIAEM